MKWTCLGIPKPCLLGAPFSEGSPADLENDLVDATLVRSPVPSYRQTAQGLGSLHLRHLSLQKFGPGQ